jgi:hypothetical protein
MNFASQKKSKRVGEFRLVCCQLASAYLRWHGAALLRRRKSPLTCTHTLSFALKAAARRAFLSPKWWNSSRHASAFAKVERKIYAPGARHTRTDEQLCCAVSRGSGLGAERLAAGLRLKRWGRVALRRGRRRHPAPREDSSRAAEPIRPTPNYWNHQRVWHGCRSTLIGRRILPFTQMWYVVKVKSIVLANRESLQTLIYLQI